MSNERNNVCKETASRQAMKSINYTGTVLFFFVSYPKPSKSATKLVQIGSNIYIFLNFHPHGLVMKSQGAKPNTNTGCDGRI